ncbi:MAG: hypothetical protein Q9216_003047 [Gyalolechia sp. 2 TL-2023]
MNAALDPSSMESAPKDDNMEIAIPPSVGLRMEADDPANPQNFTLQRKVYASSVATVFAFAVAFGITSLTVGIQGVMQEFSVSMTVATLGLSLYLLGVAFAPITTPHLSEKFGRSPIYLVSLPLFALFTLGAGYSQSFGSLAVCRFFAGFFGGPCLVLIEGTFADVWSARLTVTYYSFLSLASYIGAGCAPLILGYTVSAENWRWTQHVTCIISVGAYLLGIGVPETYPREILRSRARHGGHEINLAEAESGVTLGEMAQTTLLTPLVMAFSEPVVILVTLSLSLNFAVLFQWAGLAFIAAIVGALASAVTSSLIESITNRRSGCSYTTSMAPIEYRLIPAMVGSVGMVGSLFWIGFTATPSFHYLVPITGTGAYVWSSMSVLTGLVSYIFDAYPAKGTLSALTLMATTRIIFAAWLPLVIIQMIMGLQGKWAYSVFGFIAIAMMGVPVMLFLFGAGLRARSRHSAPKLTNGKHALDGHVDQEMQMGNVHQRR